MSPYHYDPLATPSVLKSVDDHNTVRRIEREERERRLHMTGVACPKCGGELEWQDLSHTMTLAFPPKTTAPARCRVCVLYVELER